jgi:UDP-galactopyranose mutase
LLGEYRRAAIKLPGISFAGRLGTYRYLDMDAVIEEALHLASLFVKSRQDGTVAPIFPNEEGALL